MAAILEFFGWSSDRVYFEIAGNIHDLDKLRTADWVALQRVVPRTYLATAPDPLQHIIRHMIGPEFLGKYEYFHIWHYRGKYYSAIPEKVCADPPDIHGYNPPRVKPEPEYIHRNGQRILVLSGARSQVLCMREYDFAGRLKPYGHSAARNPDQVRALQNKTWYVAANDGPYLLATKV